MKIYEYYIKSHCDWPDLDGEIEGESMEDAINKFCDIYHWDGSYEDLKDSFQEVKDL
jgi:hypothetical protein